MKNNYSLHDIRKANNKIKLLNTTLSYLKDKKFEEINIKSVCKDSEISKVTYYNYFPNKGDILLFFMSMWLYKLEIQVVENSLKGIKAINQAFKNVLKIDNYDKVMIGLVSYISSLKNKPKSSPLSELEKIKLFPDKEEIKNLIKDKSLDNFFEYHIIEAIELGELKTESIEQFKSLLLTIFYGTPFSIFIQNKNNLEELYNFNLTKILK